MNSTLMLPTFSGIFISALAPSALRMGFRILERKVETVFGAPLGRNVEEMVGAVQRPPVPKSSECPAFRRDRWAMGRPSVPLLTLPEKSNRKRTGAHRLFA